MSQVPKLVPERDATDALAPGGPAFSASGSAPALGSSSNPKLKVRSCVTCRTRKVRCDKESPCSNCRRANIPCVVPSTDRPPRWARRLGRNGINAAGTVTASDVPLEAVERIRYLESLVEDLRAQLERANAGSSSGVGSPMSSGHDQGIDARREDTYTTNTGTVEKILGRLVLQDSNKSRYVSSGFWSRVNDEMGNFDSDTSDEEALSTNSTAPTQESQRAPSDRHLFLFGHNLSFQGPDLRELHPLPSQVPFLLDVFFENVNSVLRVVHGPITLKMVRESRRNNGASLTLANEALMFSIYYAAITSMEEDDVMTNFGLSKANLNLKYRIGLEQALAKADFLNIPDLVLVQAFAIFLSLVRRHDSPRFVWMMTGLVIRMGQALGLQRDASQFHHMTPFEMEMRRRLWWVLVSLDVRSSEDQGTEFTIGRSTFDTKLPLNINDADISPETKQMPTAREGITDMTFPLIMYEMSEIARKMVGQSAGAGGRTLDEQSRLVQEIYQKVDQGYLQYSIEQGNILNWTAIIIARLVMAKMTLLTFSQFLFSSPSENFTDTIKDKLLVAAIEIAEYNHALNAEPKASYLRWVYQTYTHWYAIVYMLMEISRRSWSPIVERAWVALHSEWLIPSQAHMDKNLRFWVPLKKMTTNARKHRDAELERLKREPHAVQWLEMEDRKTPIPASPGTSVADFQAAELHRRQWRELVAVPGGQQNQTSSTTHKNYTVRPSPNFLPATYTPDNAAPNITFDTPYVPASMSQYQNTPNTEQTSQAQQFNYSSQPTPDSSYAAVSALPLWGIGPTVDHWLWADSDPGTDIFSGINVDTLDAPMDLDLDLDLNGEVDWYKWVDVAKGM